MEARDAARERRLSRPGLAHESDALARADVDFDVEQHLAVAVRGLQVADTEQRVGPRAVGARRRGRALLRRLCDHVAPAVTAGLVALGDRLRRRERRRAELDGVVATRSEEA